MSKFLNSLNHAQFTVIVASGFATALGATCAVLSLIS